ncbi:MAG TPA: RNA pseudouridine synthase [Porphyromonadaceae bacterium]|nr:RNA pseudouridine synthase [Porphyromonadaceae bacterium]
MDIQNDDFEGEEEDSSPFKFVDGENAERFEHFRFVVDRGQSPLRVDKFISDRIEGCSRNRIQNAADAGMIFSNGKVIKSNYKVKPLDIITIEMGWEKHETHILPEDIPLNIVYEDEELMVVNKPAGMVVHPGHGNYEHTLLNAVSYHWKDCSSFDSNDPRLGLVHRIDKDTSGLLVVAKTPTAKTFLGNQFFNKTTKREYIALVWGNIEEDKGDIEGNIGRDPKNRECFKVFTGEDKDKGKTAKTHYFVEERFGYTTMVRCILETGRTHQIRVHMKHIGHTLFNDAHYGGNEILRGTTSAKYRQFVQNCFTLCPRQALHAKTLGFIHPTTKKELFFSSELPKDMNALMEKWRGYNAYTESI